ncbi:hypothetical protein N7471_013839 [Penicillium samsonianum]|uniref:uncharacterized protein n=1 Tax=Penicillium samsonianum TaxID=1882272 RepID=UPI0025478AD1|nr:uncharacterized protein N7471_013839 [Penicillium samsonianum]KAJ6118372.1 hypothetical protein N7471_013839 [Penicillium samsonianum]
MSKVLTNFGATSSQGSSEFKVRGITRNISKKSAQDLANRGVDVPSQNLLIPGETPTVANNGLS